MISDFKNKDYWLSNLMEASHKIDAFIDDTKDKDRQEISENILLCLRHFVEYAISYLCVDAGIPYSKTDTHQAINETSLAFAFANRKQFSIYCDLHDLANNSVSHEIVSFGDYAERLMVHFYSYLVKIKKHLKDKYGIDVLNNLNLYPLNTDTIMEKYYSTINRTLQAIERENPFGYKDIYYIHNKKTVFINNSILYEYTISIVNDNYDKADKMIAFSHKDIFDNYAVELQVRDINIKFEGIDIKIDFIVDYEISIRNCEFEKMLRAMSLSSGFSKTNEYYKLMSYIKKTNLSIAEIIKLPNKEYGLFEREVLTSATETHLQKLFKRARRAYLKNEFGINTIMYLLATMNNSTLSNQLPTANSAFLSDTSFYLRSKVYPFETTPYCSNLYNSSVSFDILLKTIPIEEHRCELVKREIDNYSKKEGLIYCPVELFSSQKDLQILVQQYNNKIRNYRDSAIRYCCDNNNKQYLCAIKNEDDIKVIFGRIYKYLHKEEISQYSNYARGKINAKGITFDDPNKEDVVIKMYDGRSIFAVYGPAGTGKSFLTSKVIDVLDYMSPLCLTTTYAAKDNLKRKIGSNKAYYDVIEKVIKSDGSKYAKHDLLILDECSTISNNDMARVLEKLNPKLILLLGDVYQIESIHLGNWFNIYQKVFPKVSFVELDRCFRTKTSSLKDYWRLVRSRDKDIIPFMNNHFMNHPLNKRLFDDYREEDTVMLCLNYNGLFGINNINKIMQSFRKGKSVTWRKHIYKVGDPVIFKENRYYKEIFYNNLKGIIRDIEETDTAITFHMEVFDVIEQSFEVSVKTKGIEYLDNGHTMVTFVVSKSSRKDYDSDIRQTCVVPFNVAYAISIHKAQGLEFKNVRVIISNQSEELITHNIFYTAVTRAVENVDVYWSPETENKVISSFSERATKNDISILYRHIFIPSGMFKKTDE